VNAQILILAILNFGEATGYEIKKMSTEGAYSYFVDISYGSIYPTLARLEKDGLVTVRAEQKSGKPDRKIYSITEQGRLEFIKSLCVLPSEDKFKSEFLLIAMMAEMGTRQSVTSAVDARIEFISAELEMIKEHLVDCDHPGTKWVGEYGKAIKQFDLDFLKKNRDSLIAIAGTGHGLGKAAE